MIEGGTVYLDYDLIIQLVGGDGDMNTINRIIIVYYMDSIATAAM